MRVSKWLMKKGAIGSAARSIIKAYHIHKKSDPGISDREIFTVITKWRYSIKGNNIDPLFVGTAAQPKTLREFLKSMIIYEGLPYSIDSADIIGEVIDELCDEAVS